MNILLVIQFPQKVIHSTYLNKFGSNTRSFDYRYFQYLSLVFNHMLTIKSWTYSMTTMSNI